ncbi:MAG: right-handed parallel beta-helix repeat-containing protein, partial [Vicinamibacterales bacterium]|nr:right-handed parallel beta-helix repeat-containing protein [Vicinamibacterales bacterium]
MGLLGGIGGNAPGRVAAQAELTVCASGCEHTSVQSAVDAAAEGDIIKIATGVYTGVSSRNGSTQLVYIGKSVTLRGGYNATFTARDPALYPTTLDAGGLGRVLYVTGPIDVTVEGLRLLNGHARLTGGGIYSQNATVRVLKSRVADNTVTGGGTDGDYGYGAGIYVAGGSFSAQDCVIQDNRHLADVSGGSCAGGGLYATGSTIDLRNSQFIGNRAVPASHWGTQGTGGGAHLETCVSVIQGVTFRGNTSGTANGGGGGLFARFGSLQLADSIFDANQHGGATLYVEGVQVTGNTITGSTGPGLTVSNWVSNPVRNVLIARNTIRDSSGLGLSVAKVAESLVIEHNTVSGNQGGGLSLTAKSDTGIATGVIVRHNVFQSNTTTQAGGGAYFSGAVDVLFNRFIDNHADLQGGGIYQAENSRNDNASAVYNGNYFAGNSAAEGGALYLHPTYSVNLNISYRNMALVDNTATTRGSGICYYVYAKTIRTFTHLTLSGNHGGDGSAIYIVMGASTWSHSIIANSPVGVGVNSGYLVTFDHVLRHHLDSFTVGGTIVDNSPLTGDPAFKSDGYHISSTSAAIDAAPGSGIIEDIDNNPRPMGTAPDLGADESGYSLSANGVQATKLAAAPEWRVYHTGVNAPPSTRLEQTYMIPFGHYGTTDAPAVTSFAITDDIPSALTPTALNNPMDLDYSVSGSTSTWRSRESLTPGNWGWVGVTSVSDSAAGGQTLTNTGQFAYTLANGASHSIPLTATTTVPVRPVFPPVLFSPLDGEMCLDPGGQLTATGMAGAGMTVRLYEDGVLKGEGVANSTTGEFTITWTTALSASKSIVVNTQACESGGNCSVASRDVRLTYPEADWCAQRSYWEGDLSGRHYRFYFRNERGRYATNDFVIPGVQGFSQTKVHLYSCCETNDVNPFTVKADGVSYQSPSAHDGRWWTFNIGAAHNVTVESQCHSVGGTTG